MQITAPVYAPEMEDSSDTTADSSPIFDRNPTIEFAFGDGDRGAATNRTMAWRDFCTLLSTPYVDVRYSFSEYMALNQDEKKAVKRRPFFVGGPSEDGSRNQQSIVARSLLTLDVDHIVDTQLIAALQENRLPGMDAEAFVYSTRSHAPEQPRIRIVAPFSRMVDQEEYDAISRIVADWIDPGLAQTDSASSLAAQMMYLPSISRDQKFLAFRQAGQLLDPDKILTGVDLNNTSDPTVPLYPKERQRRLRTGGQLGDPGKKSGVVGAFCRAYDVAAAIGAYLPGIYRPTSEPGRWTYAAGSSSGGAKIYGAHLHSWHDTDPCGSLTVNAYDLVRIHRFGHMDAEAPNDTPFGRLPSQIAMRDLARKDPKVLAEMPAHDTSAAMNGDKPTEPEALANNALGGLDAMLETKFVGHSSSGQSVTLGPQLAEGICPSDPALFEVIEEFSEDAGDEDWRDLLARVPTFGKNKGMEPAPLQPGSYNVGVILQYDTRVNKVIARDLMADRTVLRYPLLLKFPGSTNFELPDGPTELTSTMRDVICAWMQAPSKQGGYGFKPTQSDVAAAVKVAAERNRYNPLTEMILAEPWDGQARLDDVFIRHLGCEDNPYTRQVGRLTMIAMIARAFKPGTKFDFVPVLEGPEGCGKSSFVRELSGDYYASVARGDMHDTKKMLDKINATWVVEMPELAVLNGLPPEQASALITETLDNERMAYKEGSMTYRRGNIFIGTTNAPQYLTKRTGNRRFWPIQVRKMIDIAAFRRELPQLYAEAYSEYLRMSALAGADKSGVQRYNALPLFFGATTPAGQIALRLQQSRLVEQTEDSALDAFIGNILRPACELEQANFLPQEILRRLKRTTLNEVDADGQVISCREYLAEVPLWPVHDALFPDVPYHARQSPLSKAIPAAPWAKKSRTVRLGIDKYGQQVVYAIDISVLMDQHFRDVGDGRRCLNGIIRSHL